MHEKQIQTLVVLAEERVGRRVAEDAIEGLSAQLEETKNNLEKAVERVAALESEKGILLNDVSNLTRELEEAKGGK